MNSNDLYSAQSSGDLNDVFMKEFKRFKLSKDIPSDSNLINDVLFLNQIDDENLEDLKLKVYKIY